MPPAVGLSLYQISVRSEVPSSLSAAKWEQVSSLWVTVLIILSAAVPSEDWTAMIRIPLVAVPVQMCWAVTEVTFAPVVEDVRSTAIAISL